MDLRVGLGLAAFGAASGIIIGGVGGAMSAADPDTSVSSGAGQTFGHLAIGTGVGAALGVGVLNVGTILGDGGWLPPSTVAYGAIWGGAAGLAGTGAFLVARSLAD